MSKDLYIGYLRPLKKPILAIIDGNVITKIASFDSKERAKEFLHLLQDRDFNVKVSERIEEIDQ